MRYRTPARQRELATICKSCYALGIVTTRNAFQEAMNSNQPYSCENVISVADEPHHHLIIDTDYVRVYAVEIAPRHRTLCHLHTLPYLLYVAGEAEIVSAPRNGDAQKHHYFADYCDYASAGLEHVVDNLADTPFRNLVFETLPTAEQLRRKGPSSAHAAGVHIAMLYSGDPICAELITLSSGSQADLAGPAVIASPYEEAVEVISAQHGTRKLEHFRDMIYLPEAASGLLRCEAGGPARALVVTLGCQ